jgi:CDP-glucose 4,6-dehydratase
VQDDDAGGRVDRPFWRGRRVLLTGHTGFKGAWLLLWLQDAGAEVTALALPPEHDDGIYSLCGPWADVEEHTCDLRQSEELARVVRRAQPEVVLHLAAQALVRRSYETPLETWGSNVMGTANLLQAVTGAPSVRAVVVVTSDKVYRNDGAGRPFREDDPLGQYDPYSSSKAATELVVESWRKSFFRDGGPAVATARAGNVIGGGDQARDRLVPDVLRAVSRQEVLQIRFPDSVRPWQHVLEPLHGYLRLAEHLAGGRRDVEAVNFGPELDCCRPVAEVVTRIHELLGSGSWQVTPGERQEAALLRLDSTLARDVLGWSPRLDLERALAWTVQWYEATRDGADVRAVALDQLHSYSALAGEKE